MRLVMRSFDMRRTWYDINATNNIFYWWAPGAEADPLKYTGVGVFYPIVIQPGTYTSFDDVTHGLALAIQVAINATSASTGLTSVVTYLPVTRNFSIVISQAGSGAPTIDANGFFVSFYDDSERTPPNVSALGFLNDSGEILGVFQTNSLSQIVPAFGSVGGYEKGVGTYVGPFPAQLSSLEAVYIRSSLGTSNFASSGFEPQVPNSNTGLNVTQLWARVELNDSVYDPLNPFITYVEPSDGNYPLYLQYKQLDQMVLQVTDDKGRDLSLLQTYPGQAQSGALSYKMVFSWEVLTEVPALSRPVSLATIQANPPFCRP